jgi:S1-C subfamily serine protease
VALGLIANDCQDDRGRNATYVTRFVSVQGAPSPAARAGVVAGDRIVRLDACTVDSTYDLVRQLRSAVPGWVPRLVVERKGRELEVFVPTLRLAGRNEPLGAPNLSTAGCRSIGRKPAT